MAGDDLADLTKQVVIVNVKLDALTEINKKQYEELLQFRTILFGDAEKHGVIGRQKIMEARLQIFWWMLSVVGTAALALFTQAVVTLLKH